MSILRWKKTHFQYYGTYLRKSTSNYSRATPEEELHTFFSNRYKFCENIILEVRGDNYENPYFK